MMPSWGSAKPKKGRPPNVTPQSSQSSPSTLKGSQEVPRARPVLAGKGVIGGGKVGTGGKGLGQGGFRRHRKIVKDSVRGITKGDLRRLARRGGVKRISGNLYDDIRTAMTDRLKLILEDCTTFVEHAGRKTVTVTDVIFALKRHGRPIYGFDPK